VKPAPFPLFPQRTPTYDTISDTVPLPDGLPAPVDRFYRTLYGDRVPVIESAAITGRASLRLNGISFPARFRFTHIAGQAYRHYIEVTFFGLPLMRVNEHYLEGHARLENPFGVTENAPKVDQGANLALWGEALWFPSLLVTDPRVRWEPVDDETALLVVPFDQNEERFVVRFDPNTGMITVLEAMRYREADSAAKTLWLDEVLVWGEIDDQPLMAVAAVTWFNEKSPWAEFRVEDAVYNVDVTDYVRQKGY
jgi:hypothetical protein